MNMYNEWRKYYILCIDLKNLKKYSLQNKFLN